jgi:hypothetical protein
MKSKTRTRYRKKPKNLNTIPEEDNTITISITKAKADRPIEKLSDSELSLLDDKDEIPLKSITEVSA